MKAFIAFFAVIVMACRAEALDFDLSEQDSSLGNMKNYFDAFNQRHHRYPRYWSEMSFYYACGAWYKTAEFSTPSQRTKSWKPKYCKFIYVINDKDRSFKIELHEDTGKLAFVYEHDPSLSYSPNWVWRLAGVA